MKLIIINFRLFVVLFLSVVFSSCSMNGNGNTNGEEDILFQKSVALIEVYTDSIHLAKDTIAIQQLTANFETALDKLNNSVPPETDMRLSEGQNDTLSLLVEKWLKSRDESLKRATGQLLTDSLSGSDSIAIPFRPTGTPDEK